MSGNSSTQLHCFKCCLCYFKDSSSHNFLDHYITKHKVSVDVGCWCIDCGRIFETGSYYVAHIDSCIGKKLIWHKCGVPGCSFGDLDIFYILTHMCQQHVGQKPKCQTCLKCFSNFFQWINHIQNVCPSYPAPPYSVEISSTTRIENKNISTTKEVEIISPVHSVQPIQEPTAQIIPEITIDEEMVEVSEINCQPETAKTTCNDILIDNMCGFRTWDEWWAKLISIKQRDSIEVLKTKSHFFRCMNTTCTYSTQVGEDFITHLSQEHKNLKQCCSFCLGYFALDSLVPHTSLHASQLFQCPLCIYRASTPAHVLLHQKDFHKLSRLQKIWKCTAPSLVHSSVTEVIRYEQIKPFHCTECPFQTRNVEQFGLHQSTHPSEQCFVCHLKTTSFNELLEHLKTHGINDFHCYFCPFGSPTPDRVFEHICINHPEKPLKQASRSEIDIDTNNKTLIIKPRPNTLNDKSLPIAPQPILVTSVQPTLSATVTDLQDSNTSIPTGPISPEKGTCVVTTKESSESPTKVVHESNKTTNLESSCKEVSLVCVLCDVSQLNFSSFKLHLISNHNVLEIFQCKFCKKSYQDLDSLETHTKIIHGKLTKTEHVLLKIDCLEDEDILHLTKPFQFLCVFCEYQSTDKGEMIDHLSEEISYHRCTCQICGHEEIKKKDLDKHITEIHSKSCLSLVNINIIDAREVWIQNYLLAQACAMCELSKCPFPSKPVFSTIASSCQMCQKTFTGKKHLEKHLYDHLQYKPYKCSICHMYFHFKKNVSKHIIQAHHGVNEVSYNFSPCEKIDEFINTLTYGKDNRYWPLFYCQNCSFKDHFVQNVLEHGNKEHPLLKLPALKVYRKNQKSRSCVSSDTDTEASDSKGADSKGAVKEIIQIKCIAKNCNFETGDVKEHQRHWKSNHKKQQLSENKVVVSELAKENEKVGFKSNSKTLLENYTCSVCNAFPFSITKLKAHMKEKHPSSSCFKKTKSVCLESEKLFSGEAIDSDKLSTEYSNTFEEFSSEDMPSAVASSKGSIQRDTLSNDSVQDRVEPRTKISRKDSPSSSNQNHESEDCVKYPSSYRNKPKPVDLDSIFMRVYPSSGGTPCRVPLKYYTGVYYKRTPIVKLEDSIKYIKFDIPF